MFVGGTLTGEVEVTDVYQRKEDRGGKMTFVEYTFRYWDQDDDLVLTEYQIIIETEGAIERQGHHDY